MLHWTVNVILAPGSSQSHMRIIYIRTAKGMPSEAAQMAAIVAACGATEDEQRDGLFRRKPAAEQRRVEAQAPPRIAQLAMIALPGGGAGGGFLRHNVSPSMRARSDSAAAVCLRLASTSSLAASTIARRNAS